MAAGDLLAASVLGVVETKVSETDLAQVVFCAYVAEDDTCIEDEIVKISTKFQNLLLILITGDTNAAVRRCRWRHGPQEQVSDTCAVSWDKAEEQAALNISRVKEEVEDVAKSRRDMTTSKPMDVGAINKDHRTDESSTRTTATPRMTTICPS